MTRVSSASGWVQAAYVGAGFALGGLGLYFSLRDVEWAAVEATLRAVQPGWLILALACTVGVAWLKAARWYHLFVPNSQLDAPALGAVLILAQVINIVVPVRGGGEMLRIGLVARRFSISTLQIGGTLLVEKLVDSLVLLGIVLVISPQVAQVIGQPVHSTFYWWLIAGGCIAVVVAARFRASVVRWFARWPVVRRRLDQLLGGFDALRSTQSVKELTAWTAAVWALSFGSIWGTMQAAQVALPAWGVAVLILLLYISFLLPTPPGLIGLVQYVCVLVLPFFGINHNQALGTGIVLHLVLVLPLLALAFPAWLFLGRKLL